MTKFKVGDKVRMKKEHPVYEDRDLSKCIGVVHEIDTYHICCLWTGPSRWVDAEMFDTDYIEDYDWWVPFDFVELNKPKELKVI